MPNLSNRIAAIGEDLGIGLNGHPAVQFGAPHRTWPARDEFFLVDCLHKAVGAQLHSYRPCSFDQISADAFRLDHGSNLDDLAIVLGFSDLDLARLVKGS